LNFKIFGNHINGGFSEFVNVPERHVHRMRDGLSYEEAALVEPSAVACHALLDVAKVEPMDFATVLGPGPIGSLAAQVARASGCANILIAGIDVDDRRLAIARELGFGTIKSTQTDPVQKTLELTRGDWSRCCHRGCRLGSGFEPSVWTG
jgi:threonine dehydrogenase-like Zn-dependent dehydrogenase